MFITKAKGEIGKSEYAKSCAGLPPIYVQNFSQIDLRAKIWQGVLNNFWNTLYYTLVPSSGTVVQKYAH